MPDWINLQQACHQCPWWADIDVRLCRRQMIAMARSKVESYGATLVARSLEGVARHAADLRPAEPGVRLRAAEGYARAFRRQGPGWQPLKASTIRSRISEGFAPGPILHKTGSYQRAASSPVRLIVVSTRDSFIISVDDDVAKFHQSGTRKMPRRPLMLSFGDRVALANEINKWIMNGYYT